MEFIPSCLEQNIPRSSEQFFSLGVRPALEIMMKAVIH
jgi:hypothetical protein